MIPPATIARPRAFRLVLAALALAVVLAPLAVLFIAGAGAPPAQAQAPDPSRPATAPAPAAPAPASAAAPDAAAAAPNFGAAVPSDQFIQNFQQQVTRQLQSALSEAREQGESRMRQWEDEQRQASEQIARLQQALAQDPRGRVADGPAADGAGPPPPDAAPAGEISPPQVHSRTAPERGPPSSIPAAFDPFAATDAGATAVINPSVALTSTSRSDAGAGTAAARAANRRTPNIAPHGFIEGRLLNGVVAVVGGPERESIVALQGQYESANGFRARLDGCMALVQGRSDAAAGRIDFKLSRLTCNFPDGASHTWDTAGWLVDADGIRGLRARLVSNLGAKAGLASLGGAIDGLGQRLSQEQYRNSFSALGSNSALSGSAGLDAAGGAASGAARSSAQAINEAYNLFPPSLQVGGGTAVTVVLANELRLPAAGREVSSTYPASAP